MKFLISTIALALGLISTNAQAETSSMLPDIKYHTLIYSKTETFDGPTVSDNGQALVFRGTQNQQQVIYVANKEKGTWQPPVAAITLSTPIQGITQHFKSFAGETHSGASTNFNGPTINNGVLGFAAELSDGGQGVFYAKKSSAGWVVHPIALTGKSTIQDITHHRDRRVSIRTIDAPYVTELNGKTILYFIANSNTKDSQICEYQLSNHTLTLITSARRNASGLTKFWDMSVDNGHFAVRSQTSHGTQGIYAYRDKRFVKLTPDLQDYPALTKKYRMLGGPSYFLTEGKNYLANLAAATDQPGAKSAAQFSQTAIFSNYPKAKVNATKVFVETHDKVLNNHHFGFVFNPTLSITNDEAQIAFQGTVNDKGQYATFAEILKDTKQIRIPLRYPGEKTANGVIKTTGLGPVSIRAGVVPIYVTYENNAHAIVVAEIK